MIALFSTMSVEAASGAGGEHAIEQHVERRRMRHGAGDRGMATKCSCTPHKARIGDALDRQIGELKAVWDQLLEHGRHMRLPRLRDAPKSWPPIRRRGRRRSEQALCALQDFRLHALAIELDEIGAMDVVRRHQRVEPGDRYGERYRTGRCCRGRSSCGPGSAKIPAGSAMRRRGSPAHTGWSRPPRRPTRRRNIGGPSTQPPRAERSPADLRRCRGLRAGRRDATSASGCRRAPDIDQHERRLQQAVADDPVSQVRRDVVVEVHRRIVAAQCCSLVAAKRIAGHSSIVVRRSQALRARNTGTPS